MQQLDRRAAVLGAALVELARLLVRVDVADQTVGVGVGGDLAQPVGGDGADAVGGDADLRAPRDAQLVDAREEASSDRRTPLPRKRGSQPRV